MTPSPAHHRPRRRSSRAGRDDSDEHERAEKRRRRSFSTDRPRNYSRSAASTDHARGRDEAITTHSRHRSRSRSRSRTRHHKSSRRRTRSRSRHRDPKRDHQSRRRSHSRDSKRRHRSRSPPPKRKSRSRSPLQRSRKPLPSQELSFATTQDEPGAPKQQPNFAPSGLLAREANTVAGTDVVLKYHEPADAREPPGSQDWRLYIFKGDEVLETVPLAQRSCWLFGRERAVVDVRVEHPSASKQHVVVQFRYVTRVNEFGDKSGKVKPYLIDLESANGTELNGERIASRRFVEVRTGDVMRIGLSEREYVFMLPPKE